MPQQALGREDDERQRIPLEQRRLPPQHVEVLRRGGAVHQPQVDVGGRLQEALGARARVLGALALVAVRQQEHQRRLQPPLRPARGDELVEDDLRAVDEVAVLGFPDHQVPRLLHVVAELEADRRGFGERAVVDLERGPRLRQLLQRHVLDARIGVVQHRVAVAEGAALHVLAGEADRDALGEDARQRQLFGAAPSPRCARSGLASIARFRSRPRSSFLCTVKPSGVASSDSLRSRSSSIGTPVCVLAAMPGATGVGIGGTKSSSGLSDASVCSSTVKCFFTSAVGRVLRQRAVLRPASRRRARAPWDAC